jgi:hypothetical protein
MQLTKNPDALVAVAPKRARKKPSARAAPAPAVINEPQADWKPLLIAPFYYGSSGYIRTPEEWGQYLHAAVANCSALREIEPAPWSLEVSEGWSASITAMGMTTTIRAKAGSVHFGPVNPHDIVRLGVHGHASEVLEKDWNSFPSELQKAAKWHQDILRQILIWSEADHMRALTSGAARIMARKNTVLAPFECITWDQWQYFTLDKDGSRTARHDDAWHDPRPGILFEDCVELSSATGPAGERLFAIHIAPGAGESRELGPEEKCLRELSQLLGDYPDTPPARRDDLYKQLRSKIPDLPEAAFLRCWARVQADTGNRSWSKPGRRSQSPR